MASETEIANMALAHLGAQTRIINMDEDSVEAMTCKLMYPQARDATLAAFQWNFARGRLALALLPENHSKKWLYAYSYPQACITAREIDRVPTVAPIPFEVADQFNSSEEPSKIIYTNEDDAILIFTARITDTNLFSPGFTLALSYMLAFLVCGNICGDDGKRKDCLAIFNSLIASASVQNANEGHSQYSSLSERSNPWDDARG